jgi:hypothetical protein
MEQVTRKMLYMGVMYFQQLSVKLDFSFQTVSTFCFLGLNKIIGCIVTLLYTQISTLVSFCIQLD